MTFDFFELLQGAKYFARRFSLQAWIIVVLFVLCFLLVVFFQVWGLVFGLVLIIAVVFVLISVGHNVSLEAQRQRLLEENKEVEKRFLKHVIDERTFKQIVADNEKRLIMIEAELKKRVSKPAPEEDLSQLDVRKRHKLKTLLDEKQSVLSELEIAKSKYFRHKIDDKTFQEISMEKQKKLVGLDTRISELYREEARDIMQDTARKLGGVKDFEEDFEAQELSEQGLRKRVRKQK